MDLTEQIEKLRKRLNLFSTYVVRAYLDSVMFLTVIEIANSRHPSNFLFDYSFFAIRERAIISAKSLIERKGKSKLTLDTILKDMQAIPNLEQSSCNLRNIYEEILKSDGAKRLKGFRDALCHNIEDRDQAMVFCKDIMSIISDVIGILEDIYSYVFQTRNDSFYKIRELAYVLANDYWNAVFEQANKMPNRLNELMELQKILDCNGTIMGQ